MDDRTAEIRPDYEAAAKWLQQRWESEAVQDGFPATPWDDLELEDRDWWLTQAQGVVAAALADSDALIIRRDDVMTGPAHQLVVTLLDNPDAEYLLVLLASPRQVNWCETHNHPIAADIREALDYSMSQPVPCQAASSQGVEP